MREFSYLPSAYFKITCADQRKRYPGYPKLFRQMYTDKQMAKDIYRRLVEDRPTKINEERP